jgi:ornithine carbamoyltransferase
MVKTAVKPKHLLTITDLTPGELQAVLDAAIELKTRGWISVLKNKTMALVFEKPSLRTRVSFEVAMRQMGGQSLYLSPEEVGLGKRESIPDVARVLSRFVDVIVVRTFAQHNLEVLAEYSSVPVINALSDFEHPCQAVADLLTIYEIKGKLKWLTVAYIGDGNNVANSLMLACAMTGVNFNIASPQGYTINEAVLKKARTYAKTSGAKILSTQDPRAAAKDVDVIYTDTWTSMGQEAEAKVRRKAFADYQINETLMALTKRNAIIMHCLPAHHGEEVSVGLLDSPQSVVFDQAENRMHAQKALLAWIFAKK